MSLYNMLHGYNPAAPLILECLALAPTAFARFRDAWVERNDSGLSFCVLTRNGGNNREHFVEEGKEAGPYCGCPGCTMKFLVPNYGGYERDEDDSFDSTYAYVYFRIPEEVLKDDKAKTVLEHFAIPHENMKSRTDRAVAAIEAGIV